MYVSLSIVLRTFRVLLLAGLLAATAGCAVLAVADAVVTVGAVVVKTTAKAGGAVIDAVLPDSKKN
jgi:hypothetical protein